MSNRFTGKTALVTGASKGIGAAIAKILALHGANVIVNYNSDEIGANNTIESIKAEGGNAIALKGNVSNPAEITALFEKIKENYQTLDILVNNAGIYEFSGLDNITPEHFHKQFNTNVLGLLLITQAAARIFNDGGSIINISSAISTMLMPESSVYSATKASVDAITMVLVKELAPRKIRVNAINPGMVITEGVKAVGFDKGDLRAYVESTTPLGRVGEPEDIASVALFLASDESSYVNGQTIHVSGGSSR